MTQISKKFDPKQVENKWYQHWMDKKYFKSTPDERESYTIVIPPPNVTGVLHMGHMLNNTIQDVLIRRARHKGYNACWVPGTDHASIATEAKVVKMLRERGIKKSDLSRDEFMEYAWEWKEKYGGIILDQLKRLGASCDWDRTKFTMDADMSKSVIKVFIDWHKKGYIYRGLRMTNWDPKALTVLSNEEVIHSEENSNLYHVKYSVEGADDLITIATTRPETIMGDTAIAVHPDDERYKHLHGKKAIVPMVNRSIPIITDEYVDIEFGTGCLKITPAHDPNDYELGKKHDLEVIDILNPNGTLNEKAELFVGENRFNARKMVIEKLENLGILVKTQQINHKVGRSERTNAVVEPRLTLQWFVNMKELAVPGLENVLNDEVKFHTPRFKNMYRSWMDADKVRDWCISRQLWWGQRIPAYFLEDGSYVVAETPEEALKLAQEQSGNTNLTPADLKQDEDVLDTWFSSGIWPISVFNGFETEEEVSYYYPTKVLVTGWDIIFFWVARMIMSGYEFRNEKPFEDVYFTGMVRDEKRRKMSKSLGNSPDPLLLMEKYGADGVRIGMLFCSPAGGDLLFDEKLCEQGRNFSNKIWNVLRLLKGFEVKAGEETKNQFAKDWITSKWGQVLTDLEGSFEEYRISEAVMTLYNFLRDDFSGWFLEMVKPDYEQPIDQATYDFSIDLLEEILVVLHPFMPFITEEAYHAIKERAEGEDCIVATYPKTPVINEELLNTFNGIQEIVSKVREIKKEAKVKMYEGVPLYYHTKNAATENIIENDSVQHILAKLVAVEKVELADKSTVSGTSFVSNLVAEGERNAVEITIGVEKEVDTEAEKERLTKEAEYLKGFMKSIEKKLSNERFVNNAPEQVVLNEKNKLADSQNKLAAIEEMLKTL